MTTGPRTRQGSGGRRPGGPMGRRRRGRNTLKAEEIDYKDVHLMRRFVSERGKLVSGQRVGVSAKNQRRLARAIKRAQHLALIPMAPNHAYVTGSVQTDGPARPEAPSEPVEETETPAADVSQNGAPSSSDESSDEAQPSENAEASAVEAPAAETPAAEAQAVEDQPAETDSEE